MKEKKTISKEKHKDNNNNKKQLNNTRLVVARLMPVYNRS